MIDEKPLTEMVEKYFQEAIKTDFAKPFFGTESAKPTSITYAEVKALCEQFTPHEAKIYKFNYELFTMFPPVYKPSVFLFGPAAASITA